MNSNLYLHMISNMIKWYIWIQSWKIHMEITPQKFMAAQYKPICRIPLLSVLIHLKIIADTNDKCNWRTYPFLQEPLCRYQTTFVIRWCQEGTPEQRQYILFVPSSLFFSPIFFESVSMNIWPNAQTQKSNSSSTLIYIFHLSRSLGLIKT